MFLADFHIHSTFSDGKLAIPRIVDLYGSRGFGAIAITDHLCEEQAWLGRMARYAEKTLHPGNFPLYREILKSEAERAWDQYQMVLIPGFELTKNAVRSENSSHILALGTPEYICADGEVIDLIDSIHEQGGMAVAAHPVHTRRVEKQTYYLWNRRAELAEKLDAWEVASGKELFTEVLRSGLPILANSDFHGPRQFSSWKTVLHGERHPEAILRTIREQRLSYQYYHEDLSKDLFGIHPSREEGLFPDRGLMSHEESLTSTTRWDRWTVSA